MARPSPRWWQTVREFAVEYLMPAAVLVAAMIIVIGVMVGAGLLTVLLLPIAVALAVLGGAVLLVAEMLWRVAVLDLLLGLIGAIYAANQLVQEPVTALLGAGLGGLGAWALYLSGDPRHKVRNAPVQSLTDPMGQQHRTIVLNDADNALLPLLGAVLGVVALAVGWWLRGYGLWSFFWGAYAALALGRALAWFSVEADEGVKVFWHPFAFLRRYPPFQQAFQWWHRTRAWLGVGVARWSPWQQE